MKLDLEMFLTHKFKQMDTVSRFRVALPAPLHLSDHCLCELLCLRYTTVLMCGKVRHPCFNHICSRCARIIASGVKHCATCMGRLGNERNTWSRVSLMLVGHMHLVTWQMNYTSETAAECSCICVAITYVRMHVKFGPISASSSRHLHISCGIINASHTDRVF